MAKVMFSTRISHDTSVTFQMISHMDMECYNMAISITLAILRMEWCMEMDYGKIKKVKNLLENGRQTKLMVMACMLHKIAIIKVFIDIKTG